MSERKDVLLINDLPGYGKMALAAMIPVLSAKGIDVHTLPTALISNTFGYGKYDLLDTTDYMKNTMQVWEELGFTFDSIATGFIASNEQVDLIKDFVQKQPNDVFVMVDPIMGDKGRLYKGVKEETVEHMRGLVGIADVVKANYTEASFLIGETTPKETLTIEETGALAEKLREKGAKSVVITSVPLDEDGQEQQAVYGYDAETEEDFFFPFEIKPVSFGGTGDIFSSVMLAEKLNGKDLKTAVRKAMDAIEYLLDRHGEEADTESLKGVYLEKHMGYFLKNSE
ncbi:pyridoxamine kinase [Atopococcus tabaci]|uniref:pyridoxamine kinase n=1 Tax=Atopococcus tabaci TaxID=269774 RepID=UPI00041EF27C|nr:pyridoxamine kinase [Atopococcus tabaci]